MRLQHRLVALAEPTLNDLCIDAVGQRYASYRGVKRLGLVNRPFLYSGLYKRLLGIGVSASLDMMCIIF